MTIRLPLTLSSLFMAAQLLSQPPAQNNALRGKVLYQSSGNKPAVGVRIAEPDATAVFSVDNGDYQLKFQNKRNGATLALEVGKDDGKGQKLELVNEKEVKAAKLPASAEEPMDIIVCPAGQRDIAAQRYYRILRTTADRELEKKKKEVAALLEQKEKDYQRISDLFAQLDQMQAALDSAKIREQAFNIASINLDRASQMVKDAVKKIDEENDVEGALKILNAEALDTAYEQASALKKQADIAIWQVIEGYEFKISLLEPQFKYGEVAECYEKIAGIYEREKYNEEELLTSLSKATENWYLYGDYQNAFKVVQKALVICEKALPGEHPKLAELYNNLATTYWALGEYQKQLESNLKAIAIFEKALPVNNPLLAISYINLAVTYNALGDYQRALEFNIKAVAIFEKVLPADHPDLATSYLKLAQTYHKFSDYQKALELDQKALGIREKVLPADHPDLATSYDNLALTYNALGDHQRALEFNVKAIAIFEKVLPADHPDLAKSYNCLGITYSFLGDYQKALQFKLKANAVFEKSLPADHADLGTSNNNIAISYKDLGDYRKALDFNLKAIAIFEKSLPTDHPDLAGSYNNIATTYYFLGDYQKALEFNLKAIAIFEKSLPTDHPDLATSYNSVARTYGDLGDYRKSLEFNLKAVAIFEKSLPTDHSDLAGSYNNIATTYYYLGDYQKALEFNLKAVAILENVEDLLSLAFSYSNLAFIYGIIGDYQKSLEFNLKALDIREKVLPINHPDLAVSYTNIGRIYREVGDYEKSIDYCRKAIQIGDASNPKHRYLNRFYANFGFSYIKARQYPQAKAALEKSESLKPEEGAYRGWAMYYASQKKKKQAVESLQKAISLGFKDLKWLETEPDLKNIRKEKGYKELVEQLKKE